MSLIKKSLFVLAFLGLSFNYAQTLKKDYPITPVSFTKVKFNDIFWAPKQQVNQDVTIPHIFKKEEETKRIDNFKIAAKLKPGKFATQYPFDDSDVYKTIEAASYSLQVSPNPALDAYIDTLITYIAAAQEPDGYLYTNRTIDPQHPHEWAGSERWQKEEELSHELYDAGHLYEAATAHFLATGKRTLLDIAIKNADLIDKVFGWGKLEKVPGHEVIEMGLVKLYRVTNDEKYFNLAKFFIDKRGKGENVQFGDYAQMNKPFVDQVDAVGHAVRASYLFSGASDIAALTGDPAYKNALDKIWTDIVYKKLYLTGGIGAQGGTEGFGDPYHLPNLSAYCETCASVADVFWNQRMFLLEGDSKYIDVLERTLYNGVLSGVSLSGNLFFYPNPLASFGSSARSSWFGCACCPPNVARLIPSVPGYVYATKGNIIYVNLFVQSEAEFETTAGKISISQKTYYPWDGKVELIVKPEKETVYDLHIRIPGWARNEVVPGGLYSFANSKSDKIKIYVNGINTQYYMDNGYAVINRAWQKGDKIDFTFEMPVQKVIADSKVTADTGRVALQRGPIVYCAEGIDNPGKNVFNIVIDYNEMFKYEYKKDLLNGIEVITGDAFSVKEDKLGQRELHKQNFTAIPYYAWCNRGSGQMTVWFAAKAATATPIKPPTIASTSKVSASRPTRALTSINDLCEPENSNDHSFQYYHWWPEKDATEWVQYDFAKETTISYSKVYWFDDGPDGGCRVPASWKLYYKKDNDWVPVKNLNEYKTEKDKYNIVRFEKVATKAIRLEVKLPKDWSSGIHEWVVE